MVKSALVLEKAMFVTVRVLSFIVLAFLLVIVLYIFQKGYTALSWDFITQMPKNEMTEGGIFPALLGTLYLMIGSSLVSIPIGIITAIYLHEYVGNPALVKLIRLGVNNLAGVPSVVLGLFGLSLFVVYFDFGTSVLSGSLTLGVMNLPVIIRSTEEALITVPPTYREASISLGATKCLLCLPRRPFIRPIFRIQFSMRLWRFRTTYTSWRRPERTLPKRVIYSTVRRLF